MDRNRLGGLWSALAWLIFPLVPAVLEDMYYQGTSFLPAADPRDWDWLRWVIVLGPLLGFGFLAGATAGLTDDPSRRGFRAWLSRRPVWVAIGPWWGFLVAVALFWLILEIDRHLPVTLKERVGSSLSGWKDTWAAWGAYWGLGVTAVVMVAYGWLPIAWAAIVRAGQAGGRRAAIERGLATALGFVGSLFGTFWAITEGWRRFFFDPRVAPLILGALSLGLLSGCSGPITVGEVRRRELFQALLMSWVLGLALIWRWWSRRRPGPPGAGPRNP